MVDYSRALPGDLYLIGVGPGAPDLLTLRAVNLLQSIDTIIAPRSSSASESLALRAIRPLLAGQEVIEHVYPMERDAAQTARCWRQMADLAVARLRQGKSVAHITIGDPLIYSTCAYLLEQLGDRIATENIHAISGISAMQAAAALLGTPLLTQNDRLMLLPADDLDAVEAALDACETLVIYKIGPRLTELMKILRRHKLEQSAQLVHRAEQEKEEIFTALDKVEGKRMGYMAVLIVHLGHRKWKQV
jgi:precorrin-2/cobalt-factor-2 C20-methyltransferase